MDRLPERLAEYYQTRDPAPELVDRLTALASATQPVSRRRVWLALAVGVAAGLLLSLSFWTYYAGYRSGVHTGAQAMARVPAPTVSAAVADAEPWMPRLIVARFHADWCPRSPSIEPIYDELADNFEHEPVLFVTFDITSAQTRQRSWKLAQALGVFGLLGTMEVDGRQRVEPGIIRLLNREEQLVVKELRTIDEQPAFEKALAAALPAAPVQQSGQP